MTTTAVRANAFSFTFEWGDIPLCTSGHPNIVDNPLFSLSGVPEKAAAIRFDLTDLQVPAFRHGGGTVDFTGATEIRPGAFRYKSPCPPGGHHTYRWTATVVDAAGNALARASAEKRYP